VAVKYGFIWLIEKHDLPPSKYSALYKFNGYF
jgi:hypothetical protein